jgi:hypothetical protein
MSSELSELLDTIEYGFERVTLVPHIGKSSYRHVRDSTKPFFAAMRRLRELLVDCEKG